MASNQTSNFQLSQWEANDEVLRADFNADNLKIETALTAMKAVTDVAFTPENSPVAVGTYTGNGLWDEADHTTQEINLGFYPQAVVVWEQQTGVNSGFFPDCIGMAGRDTPLIATDGTGSYALLELTESGFRVGRYHRGSTEYYPTINDLGRKYGYIALK